MSNQIGNKTKGYYEFKDEDEENKEENKINDIKNDIIQINPKGELNEDRSSIIFKEKDTHQVQDEDRHNEAMDSLKSVLKIEAHGH